METVLVVCVSVRDKNVSNSTVYHAYLPKYTLLYYAWFNGSPFSLNWVSIYLLFDQSDTNDTKIITLNIKGINRVVKRCKILSMLKKDKVQMALLQETHLTDPEHLKLKHDWVGQIYYFSFKSKSRGVAILIHKHLAFKLNKFV